MSGLFTEPVTVTYMILDDTAMTGVDYIVASGKLVFLAGTSVQKTFTVQKIDNDIYVGNRM